MTDSELFAAYTLRGKMIDELTTKCARLAKENAQLRGELPTSTSGIASDKAQLKAAGSDEGGSQ